MTFDLILTVNWEVLDTADSPDALDYSRAYPYERWGVIVRSTSPDDLTTFTKVLALVDLSGSKDYRASADYAVSEVQRELSFSHAMGDFKYPDLWPDGPVIDLRFEESENDN